MRYFGLWGFTELILSLSIFIVITLLMIIIIIDLKFDINQY